VVASRINRRGFPDSLTPGFWQAILRGGLGAGRHAPAIPSSCGPVARARGDGVQRARSRVPSAGAFGARCCGLRGSDSDCTIHVRRVTESTAKPAARPRPGSRRARFQFGGALNRRAGVWSRSAADISIRLGPVNIIGSQCGHYLDGRKTREGGSRPHRSLWCRQRSRCRLHRRRRPLPCHAVC
jgi:hypothetical protein